MGRQHGDVKSPCCILNDFGPPGGGFEGPFRKSMGRVRPLLDHLWALPGTFLDVPGAMLGTFGLETRKSTGLGRIIGKLWNRFSIYFRTCCVRRRRCFFEVRQWCFLRPCSSSSSWLCVPSAEAEHAENTVKKRMIFIIVSKFAKSKVRRIKGEHDSKTSLKTSLQRDRNISLF